MTQLRRPLTALTLAFLVALSMIAISLPASAQTSNATEIDSCTVIDESGTYVLTQDITDSEEDVCIRVAGDVDGVTIDGDGHTIDGVDAEGSIGVLVEGEDENLEDSVSPNNVTIRDLTVTDWDTGIGFRYATGDVTDVTATSNNLGVEVFGSSVDVTDSDLSDNRIGIFVDQSSATVSDTTVTDNDDAGISAFDAQLEVRDSTVTGNGVGIDDTESTITVTDSTVADNEVPNEYSTDGDAGDSNGNETDGGDENAGDVTEFDSCIEITEPGRYELTGDIEDSEASQCLSIEPGVDDVIIDGNGYTVDGVDGGDSERGVFAGDQADGSRNVTIENLTLTDWSFGVLYDGVSGSEIRNVTVESSETALDASLSSNVTIADSTLSGNDVGVSNDGSDVEISNVTSGDEVAYSSIGTEFAAPTTTAEDFDLDSATISFEDRTDFPDIDSASDFELGAVESPPDGPDGFANVGGYLEASAGENTTGSFALEVDYEDGDVPDGVEEESIRLYQFTDGEWSELDGSEVDTDANVVSAEFDDPAALGEGTVIAPFGETDGDAGDGKDNGDVVDVGAKDLTIDPGEIAIADLDLRGPGIADERIDQRTYEIGGFDVEIEGLSLMIGGTDYRFGHLTIEVEPFDVVLENVTLGNGD